MLKQRVITALVLLAILLPALFWPTPGPFLAMTLVLVAAGGWEWGRLNGLAEGERHCAGRAHAGAVRRLLGAGPAAASLRRCCGRSSAACGCWAAAALVRAGVDGWPRIPRLLRVVGGVLALVLAWLAMAQARVIGINFLLSILVLVWVADIFAYFAGRAFGGRFTRRRLAPLISPKKSWEGVWGGMAGVVVLALAWVLLDRAAGLQVPSLYTRLAALGWPLLVLGVVFLAAMSVVGDLVESLVKRSAGVKDSSQLLPGHGGVLDRVDALLPTLPLAMMLASLAATMKQRIAVLGSTGSIGVNTLDVIARHPERFEVFALSARRTQVDLMLQQCLQFRPAFAVMAQRRRRPRAGGAASNPAACPPACCGAPRPSTRSPRTSRSMPSWRPSSAPPAWRPAWPPRAPASACCWPTRKRWWSAASCSCRRCAGRRHAAADRQRAFGHLPVAARRPGDLGRAGREDHPHRLRRAVSHPRPGDAARRHARRRPAPTPTG